MPISQPFVVQPQAMQDGGMEVVDVNFVFDDIKAKIVGLFDDLARFRPAGRDAKKCADWPIPWHPA